MPWPLPGGSVSDPASDQNFRALADRGREIEADDLAPGNRWYGIVEALPSSPAEGDRCVLKATATGADATVYWGLVYDEGEAERPWSVIGGAPLHAFDNDLRTLTNQTSYASLPTDPISVTLPSVKGNWDIEVSAEVDTDGTASGYISYAVGATAANDNWSARFGTEGGVGGNADVGKRYRHTSVASGAKIEEKARTGGNYAIDWSKRHLWIMPLRLG